MKRKVTALLTALLLTLTLCVPTLAWTEYGAIYDETDALGSDELSDLGQYTLPQLTEALHLDLRVDIFTNEDVSEGTTAGDIATYVYKDSGYGWGEEKDGISLTLVMEPLADGSYTLAETDWCVYAMLSETRGDGQELSGLVYDAVEPYLNNAQSWTGEDMAASAEALCQAINAMAATAADYLSADFPTEAQQPETVQSGEASKLGDTGMNYVFDLRGMLSDGEREALEEIGREFGLDSQQTRTAYTARKALEEDLDRLQANDIELSLDVTELGPGDHQAGFDIQLEDGYELLKYDPITVHVVDNMADSADHTESSGETQAEGRNEQ